MTELWVCVSGRRTASSFTTQVPLEVPGMAIQWLRRQRQVWWKFDISQAPLPTYSCPKMLVGFQSQPLSLIMWFSSIMNLPSLYFWLVSKACSCRRRRRERNNTGGRQPLVVQSFQGGRGRGGGHKAGDSHISIPGWSCSFHSIYQLQHAGPSAEHVPLLGHIPHSLCREPKDSTMSSGF